MIYTISTVLCLFLLLVWLFYVLYNIIGRRREKRTIFMRDPSKTKYALIYIVSYFIYLNGRLYSGEKVADAIFSSFGNMFNTIVLSFQTAPIEKLMRDSALFSFAVYACFSLIIINLLLLAFSIAGQYLWLSWRGLRFHLSSPRKTRLIIFGNNENNHFIYRSADEYESLIVDTIDKREAEVLFGEKVFYNSCDMVTKAERMTELFEKSQKKYIVVINTENDETNLKICNAFSDLIKKWKGSGVDLKSKDLKVFVFGDLKHESAFLQQEFLGENKIHFVNKYISISHNFAAEFPLTSFMNEEQIDYGKGLIKKDVDINVFLIGFGRNNQQNFLTLTVNNQFLTEDGGKIVPKKVNYYIFDKEASIKSQRLNHTFFRLDQELQLGDPAGEYLPLPETPAEDTYMPVGTDSPKFYTDLKKILTENPNECNFMIISVGSDMSNIEIAEKITERQRDWGIKNFHLFVKISNISKSYLTLSGTGAASEDGGKPAYILIGDEKNTVYNIDRLLSNDLGSLEKEIESSYAAMRKKLKGEGNDPFRSLEKRSREERLLKRFANISCALNLRTKLNLIGLDYVPKKEAGNRAFQKDAYLKWYAEFEYGNPTYYSDGELPFGFRYSPDYPDTKRTHLAMQEHLRWNAFMIRFGFVPASIKEILADREWHGKSYSKHRHYKLTTNEGLIRYREKLVEQGFEEERIDVLQKDFVVLDNLYDILDKCGFSIVKK